MTWLGDGVIDDEKRSLVWAGVRDTLPVLLGIVPFGSIVGLTAVEKGFSTLEVTAMSAIVFAGAAQLAAIFLMAAGDPLALVIMTGVMINVRFAIYSASFAPVFQSYSRLRKAVYSFLISDPAYALSIPRFRGLDRDRSQWYYLGSSLTVWLSWIFGTVVGAGIALDVPDDFPVELILPLVFLALLFPILEDRRGVATAIVAGVVATAAAPLDYNLGLLLGVTSGLLVGVSLDR